MATGGELVGVNRVCSTAHCCTKKCGDVKRCRWGGGEGSTGKRRKHRACLRGSLEGRGHCWCGRDSVFACGATAAGQLDSTSAVVALQATAYYIQYSTRAPAGTAQHLISPHFTHPLLDSQRHVDLASAAASTLSNDRTARPSVADKASARRQQHHLPPSFSPPLHYPHHITTMSSPFDINGGACVAMVGKDCVAVACDLRLGLQSLTVSNNFPKIFQYGDVFLGLTGLATDVTTVSDLFRYKVNMYRLREERNIAPTTFANLVSSSLYERRFGPYFVSPVVAGLEPKSGKPFICGFDSIGCIDFAKDFIVSGTASEQLFGMCESLWEPDLEPEDLFETISQALLNAVDRDALSGWGAHVYIIEKDKVTKRLLKGRQD
ncbi:20S proteasome subunit beta 3 [Microdochium nivale]|nr:20S proteasome subunit beta 3 [Microdochium nivale]